MVEGWEPGARQTVSAQLHERPGYDAGLGPVGKSVANPRARESKSSGRRGRGPRPIEAREAGLGDMRMPVVVSVVTGVSSIHYMQPLDANIQASSQSVRKPARTAGA